MFTTNVQKNVSISDFTWRYVSIRKLHSKCTFLLPLIEAVVQLHLQAYPKVVWVYEAGPEAA